MQATVIIIGGAEPAIDHIVHVAGVHDLAAQWGREDAQNNINMQGSVYFTLGSPQWEAYNEAYNHEMAKRIMRPLHDMEEAQAEYDERQVARLPLRWAALWAGEDEGVFG
jgi:hypothetical protein